MQEYEINKVSIAATNRIKALIPIAADDIVTISSIIQSELLKFWTDKVAHVWMIEDVRYLFPEEKGWEYSDQQAKEILENALDHVDCDYGFTWEHLKTTAEMYFAENGISVEKEFENEEIEKD